MQVEPGDVPGVVWFRRQDGGWKLALVDVDSMRGAVHDALAMPTTEAGALLLPRGLDSGAAVIRHLVGTMRINHKRDGLRWSEKAKDRQFHPEWQRRVDYLDCATYAKAAATWWRRKQMRTSGEKTESKATPPAPAGFLDGYEVTA